MSIVSGTTLWNLIGCTLLASGIVLALWCLFWDRSRGRLRCPRCWYRVEGVPISLLKFHRTQREAMKCPECGEVIPDERMLRRTRRRCWLLVPALLLIMLAPQAWEQPARIGDKETWQRAMPTWLYVFGGFSSDNAFKDSVEAEIKKRRTRVNAFGRAWMDYWWENGLWKEAESKLYVPKKVRIDSPFVACIGTPVPDTYSDHLVDDANIGWKSRRVGVVSGEAFLRRTGSAPAWNMAWEDSIFGNISDRAVMPSIKNTGENAVELGLMGWDLDGRIVITSTTRTVLGVATFDEAIPTAPDDNIEQQLKDKVRLRIVKGRLYQEIVEVDFSNVILGQSCVSLRVELMQGKALVGGSKAILLSDDRRKMYFEVAQPFLRELVADIGAESPAFSWSLQMNDNNYYLQGQAVCESAWTGSVKADAIAAARRE